MSETLTKQFNAHIGSRVSYKLTKEGYFDKTGSVVITEDGQVIDLTDTDFIPYDSQIQVIYNPQNKATVTVNRDYEIVGKDVVVTDEGIASGFNDTSWILVDNKYKIWNSTLHVAFTTPAVIGDESIVHATGFFTLETKANGTLNSWSYEISKNVITYNIQPNTKYYLKIAVSSNKVKSIYIHDDTTTDWTLMGSFLDLGISISDQTKEYRIGQKSTATDKAFTGTIDLLHTYITDNNDIVEEEGNIIYRPFSIDVDSSDLICAPSTTLISSYKTQNNGAVSYYTIADETIIVNNTHYAEGLTYKKRNELKNIYDIPEEYDTANFTNIDNVSIINHIASGFDLDDVLSLGQNGQFAFYAYYASNWEWNFKFELNGPGLTGQASSNQAIFAQGLSWENGLYVNANNNLAISINSTAGSSGDGRNWKTGNTTLQYNKPYWVKVSFTGTAYKLYLSEDGENFVKEAEILSSTKINSIKSDWRIGGNYNGDQYYRYPFHGKIYLDECYILLNRKVWWKAYDSIDVKTLRNKHKDVRKTTLNLTLNGDVTFSDTYISNFNGNNYATIPTIFNPGNDPWEINLTFKTSNDYTSATTYFFGSRNGDNGLLIGANSSGWLQMWLSSTGSSWDIINGSVWNTFIIQNNSIGYLKLRFDGSLYELLASRDNVNWTVACRKESTAVIHPTTLYFGSPWDKDTRYLRADGNFDLSATNIYINNHLWWKPEFAYIPESAAEKTINFSIIGTPTVTYTEAYNFSDTDYLTFSDPLNNTTTSFEVVSAIKLISNSTANCSIFDKEQIDSKTSFRFEINSSNNLQLRISTTGEYAYPITLTSSSTLSLNQKYWIKAKYNSTDGYTIYLSTDGKNWTQEGYSSDTTLLYQNSTAVLKIGDNAAEGTNAFPGIIYLDESSIKVNDSLVWQPYTENNYIRLFKTIGNVEISSDNIASGFSVNNTGLVYNKTLQNTFSNFEIKMKITTGSNITDNQIFMCTTQTPRCAVAMNVNQSKFCLYLTSDTTGSSWNITQGVLGSHTISPNTTYYTKLVYNGSNYVFSFSTDDTNYTNTITVNNSTKIASFIPTFGAWLQNGTTSDGSKFLGSIDLNECYIKVDNKLWWKGIVTEDDDIDFEQPILSANGTIGGDYFAVAASSILGEGTEAWRAFDGIPCTSSSTNYWHSAIGHPSWIEWYNPYPVALSNIQVQNRHDHGSYINAYVISYSDDGDSFVDYVSGNSPNQTALAYWNIPIAETAGHKYWRLTCNSSSGSNSNYTAVGEINLTGKIKPSNVNDSGEQEAPVQHENENFYAFGNLQINDGIVSGFSSNNIFVLPKQFIAKYNDTFDIAVKFKTPNSLSGTHNLFGMSEPLLVRLYNSYLRLSFLRTNNWQEYDLWTLSTNTTYTVRCYYSSGYIYIYLYNAAGTLLNNTSYSISDYFLRFGWSSIFCYGSQANNDFWQNTIDLTGCYIKLNDKYWWKPYNEETPSENVLLTKYTVQTLKKEDTLTEYNNYNIVGSLTNNNGIYSGFSASNYIHFNIGNSEVQTSDIITCVKLNALRDSTQDVFGPAYSASTTDTNNTPIGFSSDGKLGRYNLSQWTFGETAYPINTWIWVRQIYKNNVYYIYGLIDDNYTLETLPPIENWELETTWTSYEKIFNSILRIGNGWTATGEYFNGEIDINKTKIIINEKELPIKIKEKRNYSWNSSNNLFGISNKIASGFNGYNTGYISATGLSRFDTTKPWMIQVKVKLMTTSPNHQYIIHFSDRIVLTAYRDKNFYIWFGNNYGQSMIDGYYGSWDIGKWYWIRLMWTGSFYACYTSINGSQYNLIMTHDNGNIVTPNNTTNVFGTQYASGGGYIASPGMIDLSETFVMQDNKITWAPYLKDEYEVSEFKGFYVPEFEYTGNEMSVNAYRNTLTSGDAETLLGENPSQASDVVSTQLLKSNIAIVAPNEDAFIYNSSDEMFTPSGYYKIKFESNIENYDINISANDILYQNPNRLYVKPGTKISYIATKPGYMDLTASDVEITQDQTIELFFDKKEFKFSIDTTKVSDGSTSTDTTYILPIVYNTEFINRHEDVTIDWGDNTTTYLSYISSWTQAQLTHTYPRAGQYQITISTQSGYMPRFYNYLYTTNNNAYKLISLDSPLLKLTYSKQCFMYAYNLNSIHKDLFKYNDHITDLQDTFYYCNKLKSIPDGLLKYCKNLTTVAEMFGYCTVLTAIPEDLFKYCPKLSYFGWVFSYCYALVDIPENLFKYNINASNFEDAFYYCYNLLNIPENLFKYNLAATSFYRTFYYCNALRTIPNNLFKYNLAAVNFGYTFRNCYYLTINPNIFGEDLVQRFNSIQSTTTLSFLGMFMRQYFYGTDCGTAPELWKLTPTNSKNQSISMNGLYCFGYTTTQSNYIATNLTNFGNKTLTNFWDIPVTFGGLGCIDLTVNVE